METDRRVDNLYKRGAGRKWSYEVMVGAIVAIKEVNEPINPNSLLNNHKHLYQAIVGYPGGYDRIVEEAGFDPSIEKKKMNSGHIKHKVVAKNP